MGLSRSRRKAARLVRLSVVCLGPNGEVWQDSLEHVAALKRSGDAYDLDPSLCLDLTGPQRVALADADVTGERRLAVYVASGMPSGMHGQSCSAGPEYIENICFDRRMSGDMAALARLSIGRWSQVEPVRLAA